MSADPSKSSKESSEKSGEPSDFIRSRVRHDIDAGIVTGRVITRFPPEPNGYLHIGHAKSICLNFGVAAEFGGVCYLRFDDTNPLKEDEEYVESIQQDVHWLGFDWGDRLTYASDYFEQLFNFAVQLVNDGKAFVCSLSAEEIRATRGTLSEPGRDSPYRGRSVAESLDLFRRMRAGEFPDGAHVLRARIDMASPNVNMRDPVLYRIRHTRASTHGRCVVHLSDVRFHALHLRCARRHHALVVHARIRGSPAAVRLGARQHQRQFPSAADRILAARARIHGDEQAPAAPARHRAGTWRGGTIRVCRRSRACAGAA